MLFSFPLRRILRVERKVFPTRMNLMQRKQLGTQDAGNGIPSSIEPLLELSHCLTRAIIRGEFRESMKLPSIALFCLRGVFEGALLVRLEGVALIITIAILGAT